MHLSIKPEKEGDESCHTLNHLHKHSMYSTDKEIYKIEHNKIKN